MAGYHAGGVNAVMLVRTAKIPEPVPGDPCIPPRVLKIAVAEPSACAALLSSSRSLAL
jgi:hypothetical protein